MSSSRAKSKNKRKHVHIEEDSQEQNGSTQTTHAAHISSTSSAPSSSSTLHSSSSSITPRSASTAAWLLPSSSSTSSADSSKLLPKNFHATYSAITQMRTPRVAPVDTIGCAQLAIAPKNTANHRFQTLMALMLSSQTKDQATSAAMNRLHQHFANQGGFTADTLLSITPSVLSSLIYGVGFHNRKVDYLRQTASILQAQYNGDIPDTIEKLCELPGVGPKMAHLAMLSAWFRPVGIGVDVHVHRISNRLGWCKTNTPEATREALQEWLPLPLWPEINELLVGFGQTICAAVKPNCENCKCLSECKVGKAEVKHRASQLKKIEKQNEKKLLKKNAKKMKTKSTEGKDEAGQDGEEAADNEQKSENVKEEDAADKMQIKTENTDTDDTETKPARAPRKRLAAAVSYTNVRTRQRPS